MKGPAHIVRFIVVALTASFLAIPCTADSSIADDIGTNHLGVLQVDWPVAFPGGWIRPHPGPFIWGWVEGTPGVYDWSEPDSLVEKQQERGLAILATVWPFAQWDQNSCHAGQPRARGAFGVFPDRMYMPCDMDAYLTWLSAMVERYDGDGIDDMPGLRYPIRHWEVLNEPEMQGPQLCFFQESPDVYADLLVRSYAAIQSSDPLAQVLPAGQSGMHREATDYWEPILADSSVPFDIANIHSIRCSDFQEDMAFWAPEYVDLLSQYERETDEYWITEAQTGSVDPKYPMDEDQEVRAMFIGTMVAFAEGADVIFHVFAHDPLGQKAQLKPTTFNVLGTTIGAFETVERLSATSVRFVMPDGEVVYALWHGARLPDDIEGFVRVTTYLGETQMELASSLVADAPLLVAVP